jgi:tRNA pseudouridine55 synthase
MVSPYDGIILIDKNEGETSFDIVKKIRGVLKVKKVGHAGTLDPFATGLLVVLVGQGTKLAPYLMSEWKKYRATIQLGVETDTQDPTGRIVRTMDVPEFESDYIHKKTLEFIGEIEQVPPIFSAINYKGKRAYDLARKGIKVELKKRKVKILNLKIISIDIPNVTVEVSCSSGTYIRSLASDIGKQLGTVAHLKVLRRLSSGPFKVEDTLNSRHIGLTFADSLGKSIISLRGALPDMKETQVDDRMAKKIRNGGQTEWNQIGLGSDVSAPFEGFLKLVNDMELVAILEVHHLGSNDKGWLRTRRIFH